MIRRIFILSMILLYVTTTAGFAMNLHFCGSKVSSVSLTDVDKACCAKMAAKAMKCCKDKNVIVKVFDTHQSSVTDLKFNSHAHLLTNTCFGSCSLTLGEQGRGLVSYHASPPDQPIPLVILNCNFRI